MPDRDPAKAVEQANKKMKAAWQEGQELLDRLGSSASYGAMQKASGENASEAERLRKLRNMADRMTEKEVNGICDRCTKAGRAWGPQYLVNLSRIPTQQERSKLVTRALKERWALIELKRQIRIIATQEGSTLRKQHSGVGRRRKLDWTDQAAITDQIQRMCRTWNHFHRELKDASEAQGVKDWRNLVPEQVRTEYESVTDLIAKMVEE